MARCTLRQFGAVGNSASLDSAAYDAMVAKVNDGTYSEVLIDDGTFDLSNAAAYFTRGDIKIHGSGFQSVLATTANKYILHARGANLERMIIKDLMLSGNSTGSNQNGIEIGYLGGDGVSHCYIEGVTGYSLGGRGISFGFDPQLIGPQLVGCRMQGCGTGYYMGTQMVMTNCEASLCGLAAFLGSGNNFAVGCDFTQNTQALKILGGGNDAHGIFNDCAFDHNTTFLSCQGSIIHGMTFVGCHVYEGLLSITSSFPSNVGVFEFLGGIYDVTQFSFDGCIARFACTLDTAYWDGTYTEANDPDVDWSGCRGIRGELPSYAGTRVHNAVAMSDANLALTRQQGRADSLDISGTLTALRNVTSQRTPTRGAFQKIKNRTAQTLAYGWASGTRVNVLAGKYAVIGADGTNAVEMFQV